MRSSPAHSFRGACADARPTGRPLRGLAFAALALLAAAAPVHGQNPAAAPRPDPLDAGAPVPPVIHIPTLASYRRAGEVAVGSWREANDTVTRIGGWRAYAREANQPEAPAAAPAAQPAAGVAAEMTEGEVRKVDKGAAKLTLRHGEIRNLDMPPMTMVFEVRDKAQLDALKPGDKVRFRAVIDAGRLTVTEIQMAK
jgi:Cu(I)/Ag(I) efflux system periplasmic protein CusF